MENKETKTNISNMKSRIILNNISDRQKEVLMKSGIIGGSIGSGLLMLYSMKAPETVPGITPDTTPVYDSKESSGNTSDNSIEIMSIKPVTEISDQNISFAEAFKVAREICGSGGWFIWKGSIYNTYYQEEWQALSQNEKNDYLATIQINTTQNDDHQQITKNSEIDSDTEIIASVNDDKNGIESSGKENVNEFSVDLNLRNEETSIAEQNLSENNNVIIEGEVITLDEVPESDTSYFELPDDTEISVITDEESNLIEKLTFDSSEITSFPWETSEITTDDEIISNEIENVSIDLIDDSTEVTSENPVKTKEEYPWGESVTEIQDKKDEIQVLEEIKDLDSSKIITNSEEIKEYPWGEIVDNTHQNINQNNSEIFINEENDEIVKDQSTSVNNIEEYPWGEKIDNHDPAINAQIIIQEDDDLNQKKENIGVILPEEHETDLLSQLPPSFNEITELPWGETIPHSTVDPYSSNENDLPDNSLNHRTSPEDNE